MTVSTITRRFTYSCNGIQKAWPIEFDFQSAADVKVYLITADGVETEITNKTVGAEYVTAPASGNPYGTGCSVRIERLMDYKQLDDYTTQGAFTPGDMERTADKMVMVAQQIRDVAEDTFEFVDDNIGSILTYKNAAESAMHVAQGAQTAAETAKTGAVTAQTASESARDAAVGAKSAAEAARGAAETAAGAAQAANAGAETAKSGAESAKTGAQGAQTAAEAAKTGAVTAQTASEAARDAAVGAKTAAETARAAAETAAGVAQTAKTGAEAAKSGAESAKTSAQGAQTAAETAKTGAVTAQTASEAARDAAVGAKTAAQTAKTTAETAADVAQTAKTVAEAAEAAAETASAAAQIARTGAETAATSAAGSASAASISASNAESSASSLSYATQAEVDLGGDVAKIVSPATLKKGAAGGVAELNANTKIPAERLYITGALADGAIIESGENANGRYVKWADGTMICTKTITRNNLNIAPDSFILRLGDEIPAAAFVGNSNPGWTFLRITSTNNDSNINNNYMSCIGLFSYADGLGLYNTGGSMAYISPGASAKTGNTYYVTSIELNIMSIGRWK